MTITLTTDLPAILNGVDVEINVDSTTGQWYGEILNPGTADCIGDSYPLGTILFSLACEYIELDDETEWTLTVYGTEPSTQTVDVIRTSGECSPFQLEFTGPGPCAPGHDITYTVTDPT